MPKLPAAMAAAAVVVSGPWARADITIEYSPQSLVLGETVDLAITLRANPAGALAVAGIEFHYDQGSDAWSALGPSGFTWVPAIMHDPGQWFIDEGLPDPLGLAFFPAAAVTIPAGGSVEFARLTVTPTAAGVFDLGSGLMAFNTVGVRFVIKGGEPFALTVVDLSPGACCLVDGSCLDVTAEKCSAAGGSFEGAGTLCSGTKCPQPSGACCFGTGLCLELTETDCALAGATWQGAGSDCVDSDGNGQADDCVCLGDLDGDGTVGTSDLLALLAAWGAAGGPADLDGDGLVSTGDLLVLLSVWGPCF